MIILALLSERRTLIAISHHFRANLLNHTPKSESKHESGNFIVSMQREPSGHNLVCPTKWCPPNSDGNLSVRYAEKCDYADDGWAEADNNIAENTLRMVSLGRKNYLFFGSDHGGKRGALLYGLIGTCKLNGVEPESYLRYVLDVIADWPINRVSELLPWRILLPTD